MLKQWILIIAIIVVQSVLMRVIFYRFGLTAAMIELLAFLVLGVVIGVIRRKRQRR